MMMLSPAVSTLGIAARCPTYIYDLAVLRRQIADLEAIPIVRKRIFFATMANDHPALLAEVRDCSHGVFVNSPRHLQLAIKSGFAPERIVYAASNMSSEEM